MTPTIDTTLGELINVFYEEFLQLYGDEELASIAAAAVVNDMLSSGHSATATADKSAA
jgi:hypothetical protein